MPKILFVCLGNICRSPAGENVLRHLAQQHGSDLEIDSAGTADYHTGKSPDARMTAALQRREIPVAGSARTFSPADFDRYDLIIAMDRSNRRDILAQARDQSDRAKVKLFMSYCREHTGEDVPDPYYGGTEGFEHVLDLMEDGCGALLGALNSPGDPPGPLS